MPYSSSRLGRCTGLLLGCLFAISQWVLVAEGAGEGTALRRPAPPNIVLILADDLGFSDIGCYGGEIETPNLDALAQQGVRFTQFYNTGRCWPTRAAMLTGYYPHQIGFDRVPGEPAIERHDRPEWARLLPQRLQAVGYRSYHSGKWHLDGSRAAGGFARSYSLDDHGRFFSPKVHLLDDRRLPPVERGSGYYATTEIANRAIEFLREHHENYSDQPFFEFIAFTSPHFPLHALEEDIAKYRERYVAGWEALRESRWQRIQELGLIKGTLSAVEPEIGPPYHRPDDLKLLGPNEVNRPFPWSSLTDGQKQLQATKMAIHAAMVDRMDQEIGRVIEQLKAMGQYENTLILFLSDNGASAEIMVRDDGHDPDAVPGSASTHFCLGPGFSNASNTPFRRHKTWVHEGGIHTPLVVHWPAGIGATSQLNPTVGHVIDLVPTLLDLAGAEGTPDAQAPPFPGVSLAEAIRSGATLNREPVWWFHEGNRAIRAGDWKLVSAKNDDWELFDLSKDPTETKDLTETHPEEVARLKREYQQMLRKIRTVAEASLESTGK